MRPVSLLALAFPLVLAACRSEEAAPAPDAPAPDAAPDTAAASPGFAPSLGVDVAASTRTPSGLLYRDLVVGTGEEATAGKRVAMLYTGSLTDGTEFDGNMPGGPTLPFTIGAGEVIPGWEEGIAGMRVGGRRQLVIPPELAYGPTGSGPIPPNATLVFTVELMGIQP